MCALLRPRGILGILLIVTGIISLFFWLIVFVVLPWTFNIPLYAAAVGLVASAVFFSLIIITLAKDSAKHARDIRAKRKLEFAKCRICDASLPETTLRGFQKAHGPHYEALHPEFWTWSVKTRKFWLVAQAILIIYAAGWAVVSAYEFYRGDHLLPALLLVPVILSMLLLDKVKKRKLEYFREEWARRL